MLEEACRRRNPGGGALKEEAWSIRLLSYNCCILHILKHPIRCHMYTVCIFRTLRQIQHVNYMHIQNTPSDTTTISYIFTAFHQIHKYIWAQQWAQAPWRPGPGGGHMPSDGPGSGPGMACWWTGTGWGPGPSTRSWWGPGPGGPGPRSGPGPGGRPKQKSNKNI